MAGANSRYKSPQAWVSPARARAIKSVGSVFPGALIRPGLSGSIASTQERAQNYQKSLCRPRQRQVGRALAGPRAKQDTPLFSKLLGAQHLASAALGEMRLEGTLARAARRAPGRARTQNEE